GADEIEDAAAEIDRQAEHRAELDDDGVGLPEAVVEVDSHPVLGQAQVGGGTDREELGQAFNNAKNEGAKIVVHGIVIGLAAGVSSLVSIGFVPGSRLVSFLISGAAEKV